MNDTTKRILCFYPYARGFGYAYMNNPVSVLDSQVVVAQSLSKEKNIERMKEYIDEFEPEVVVLENYHGELSNKSKRVINVIDTITHYAESKNIPVEVFSREEIRFVFSNFEAKSKHQIATVLAENITSLKSKLKPKRKIYQSEKYTMPIFDAVSLGVTYYYLLD